MLQGQNNHIARNIARGFLRFIQLCGLNLKIIQRKYAFFS